MNVNRHTLLIVDDETDVLDSLQHLFHRKFRVLTAPSGSQALELLQKEPVQLILSDQRMPGMSGDEFLARSRNLRPESIRLLFTGYADIQAVANAINRGEIYRYILKPWDPIELELLLDQAAERYDLLDERRRLVAELQATNDRLSQANRDLAEADQVKTAFLEVASHEFNTPITVIQGLSELLLLTNTDREPQERGLLEGIRDGTRHLGRLVGDTLKALDAGEFRNRLHLASVDLAALIHQACAQVEPFVTARHLLFERDVASDLGQFEADESKILEILVQLLTNAIKFTPDEGSIRISARLLGPDQAEIAVVDTGIGLDEPTLRHLFSPLFTELNPDHHHSGTFGFGQRGLGLGLYLVKQFIELHGGSVAVTSVVNQGTTITLLLPRHPCPAPADPIQ